jgi:uncharacterized protein YqcC (DUF446 family)
MSVHEELDAALRELEAAMEAAQLWRMAPPPPEALHSEEPFCVDTMTLPQWLRFVFIPSLDVVVKARAPLPERCEVAPAVEAWLANEGLDPEEGQPLIKAVERIDRLITEN